MQSYLPKDSAGTSSGYAEGGGLYALGLIHANHGGDITEYLLGMIISIPVIINPKKAGEGRGKIVKDDYEVCS